MQGRPSVITDACVRKLEEAFRQGLSVSKACELSVISRSTFYQHIQENEEFSDKMTLAQEWATESARKVVVEAIGRGDVSAAKWWLERKAKDEFGSKSETLLPPRPDAETSLDYIKQIATVLAEANRGMQPAAPPTI